MNSEQRSSSSVPTQPDSDSSKPEADPPQHSLQRNLLGVTAVVRTGCGTDRTLQLNRRCTHPTGSRWAGTVVSSCAGHARSQKATPR